MLLLLLRKNTMQSKRNKYIVYRAIFVPCYFLTLIQLQTFSPRLEFAQTKLHLKKDDLRCWYLACWQQRQRSKNKNGMNISLFTVDYCVNDTMYSSLRRAKPL